MRTRILSAPMWRLALCLLLLPAGLHAQPIDFGKFKSLRTRCIGPAGMSGRVTALAATNSTNPVIYAGTASGGLWRSENQGTSWQPVFDGQPTQSIGSVAVAPSNPAVVWAGTGEGNPRNSHNSGQGIFRSLDGGRTWRCMGLEGTRTIHRILIDPRDERTVYAAALGSPWGPNPDRGLYKSTNAGETWDRVLFVNDSTGCADLVMDPSNPNKLLAAMWQHDRDPWFFNSGGSGSGLYMTHDGGKNWQRLDDKTGLPGGKLGRIGLAIAPSQPSVVYAMVESKATALFRSDDGGFTWKKRNDADVSDRPFYYNEMYVDPLNENRIYHLHSTVTLSEDGGKTFSTLLGYNQVHPDHHAWWIDPRNPAFMIDGNDGGMNITRDKGRTWTLVANVPVGQFYHVNYDMATPYNVMGGLQDNGSWIGPSEVWAMGGIRNYHWRELLYGDGFDMAPKPNDPPTVYAMSQGGAVNRVNRETGEAVDIRPLHPDGLRLRFNWNAALAADPFDANSLYFGSQFVHHSTDAGRSWEIISPDLTTNDTTKHKQSRSGGLTLDATAAENYTTILAITPSTLDRNLIWVGTDDGNLQRTTDGGQTWENLSSKLPGAPKGAWIPHIEPSAINVEEAFVVLNDYRRNDWTPYAYHTRDKGRSWKRIVDGEKVKGHCLALIQDPVAKNLLFLGTDQGLWVSVDAGENWTQWKKDFPAVPVQDLKIHPREHDLIIGTFGRALWIMDDFRPLRALALEGKDLLQRDALLLPAANAIQAEYRSVDGERFPGEADYSGARNPGRGAEIPLYIRMPGKWSQDQKSSDTKAADQPKSAKTDSATTKKPENKDNDLHVYVLTLGGDSIRHFTAKPDTGFQVIRWRFDRDGMFYPQYQKPGKDLPGGMQVGHGDYRFVIKYGPFRDSTVCHVLPDPRVRVDPRALAEREVQVRKYMAKAKTATRAFDQLREARSMVDRYEKLFENVPEARRDSLKRIAKPVRDSIKTLMEVYIAPEDQKGIDHVTPRLIEKYFAVEAALDPMYLAPGQNALVALRNFERAVDETVARVNRFIENDWTQYRKTMEGLKIPVWIEISPVKNE